jgi:hypothetical protein
MCSLVMVRCTSVTHDDHVIVHVSTREHGRGYPHIGGTAGNNHGIDPRRAKRQVLEVSLVKTLHRCLGT